MKKSSLALLFISITLTQLSAQDSLFVLIPGGEYYITKHEYDPQIEDNKKIKSQVSIDEFLIQKYEVTNEQYKEFIEANNYIEPKYWDNPRFNQPKQPVVGITFEDAQNYAEWRGLRLPTNIEWEIAARGGLVNKNYPNGDSLTIQDAKYFSEDEILTYDDEGQPDLVGQRKPNGFGLYDIVGNVAEFTSEEVFSVQVKPEPDRSDFTQGFMEFVNEIPFVGNLVKEKVQLSYIRGGSWRQPDFGLQIDNEMLIYSLSRSDDVGFRCVKETKIKKEAKAL